MITYTKHTLKKLETLMEELDYTVRYERGNFNSGYCMVESRKIAIINRFFETEGRINALLEIIAALDIDVAQLSEKSRALYKDIQKSANDDANTEEE